MTEHIRALLIATIAFAVSCGGLGDAFDREADYRCYERCYPREHRFDARQQWCECGGRR